MNADQKRNFDKEAASWDENPGRVKLAYALADVAIRELNPTPRMDALDYGCGTGLVTLRLQPLVRSITGADSSRGMLDVLQEKGRNAAIDNLKTRLVDFTQDGAIDGKYHLIVSTMTLHHVHDPGALFKDFYRLLHPGGILGVADLDTEDGSFHADNEGVFHFGFDRDHLAEVLRSVGFEEVRAVTAVSFSREVVDRGMKPFSVFFLIARRPGTARQPRCEE